MSQSKTNGSLFLMVLTFFGLLAVLIEAAKGRDFYNILGVRRNANDKEIKKAFRKLSLKYHPDQNPSEAAKDKYLDINAAYETLSDPEKRKMFDQFGEEGANQHAQQQHHGNPFGGFGGGFGGGDPFSFFFGGGMGGHHHQRRQQQQQRQYPSKNLYEDDPNVVELTDGTWPFYRTETDDDKAAIWFINFYHDQCGGCHTLAQAYKETAKETRGIIKVAAINCARQEQLCSKQGIKDYPSLKLYGYFAHNAPTAYPGNRDKASMVEFLNNQVPNFVKQETTLSFLEKLTAAPYKPQVLIIAPSHRKPLVSPTLLTLAKNFNSAFRFFVIPATTQDDPEWAYLMQYLSTTSGQQISLNPRSLAKPQFFIITPTLTTFYTGPASFKELTGVLTKYRTEFKGLGYYTAAYSTFVLQSRALKMTPDLLLALQNSPSAGYTNTIITCPWISKELSTFDGFSAEHPTLSKFSSLLGSNVAVEAAKDNGTILPALTPSQIAFQLFDSIQTTTKQVYVVDVTDNKMVGLLARVVGDDVSLQQSLAQLRTTCGTVSEATKDTPLQQGQSEAVIAFGLNLKRHRFTQITQNGLPLMQYLLSVDTFMELNESSPSGSKPFAKRVKVVLGLERDEL